MKILSRQRREVLHTIRKFLDEKGYPPTVRDIVKSCGMSSTSVADYHLGALEKYGYIRRDSGVSRGIYIVGTKRSRKDIVSVPILGIIAAGEPIPVPTSETSTFSDSTETLDVPSHLIGGNDKVFALIVKGQSMIDSFIDDGDIVLMKSVETANNGEMVAAWLNDEEEVTLKKLYREGEHIRLQPSNQQMDPIYVKPNNLSIKGKVIGIIRNLE